MVDIDKTSHQAKHTHTHQEVKGMNSRKKAIQMCKCIHFLIFSGNR